jgi:L-alanine-DL-glutamate epimerase-like enolase superfamily enzyme
MEIESVEAIPVEVPLTSIDEGGIAPYVTNHNSLHSIERVLVRVTTDNGTVGWGEMRVFLSPSVTVSILEDGIAPLVIGKSPFEVEALRRQIFIEYTNIDMYFSPIEIACWDIIGKDTGHPIFELLGGWSSPTRSERVWRTEELEDQDHQVPVAYCLGILSPEESAEKATSVMDEGYEILKLKGSSDWELDVQRIIAIEEAVDGALEYRIDPNQGWSPGEAVSVGEKLSQQGIQLQYMEQPIGVNMHDEYRTLRQRCPQPIAPNEDTYIQSNVRSLIQNNALDYAVLDMTPMGGITGLRQQVNLLEDAGIPASHHCAFDLGIRTSAILHAAHGLPGLSLAPDTVYYGWESDILETPLEINSGEFTVPNTSGLGIDVDKDKIDHYRVETQRGERPRTKPTHD